MKHFLVSLVLLPFTTALTSIMVLGFGCLGPHLGMRSAAGQVPSLQAGRFPGATALGLPLGCIEPPARLTSRL